MTDQPTFDYWQALVQAVPGAGETLRNAGIEQVSDNNKSWIVTCQRVATNFVATMDRTYEKPVYFTSEDIRHHCVQLVGSPDHPNAWGALINSLARLKIIRPTGHYAQAKRGAAHARMIRIYERGKTQD